jgi:ribosomal protein S18 acetylase RimI-like enzyme
MQDTTLQFRAATAEDAPVVAKLIQDGFRAPDSRAGWTGDLDDLAANFTASEAEQLKYILNPDMIVVVAEDQDHKPVGTFTATKRSSDQGDHAWLSMLAVDTTRQQAGLGRRLLEYTEMYCQRTWGLSLIKLNALSTRDALIAWYERRGYRRDGTSTPFPVHLSEFDGLNLPSDLCFINLEKRLEAAAE